LQQEPGSPALYILRRRWADGIPVALDDRYLPAEMADVVTPDDVVAESIFLTLTRKGAVAIKSADYEIGAKAASRREARLLAIKTGDPLVARKLVIYAESARPVIVGLSVYRGDVFRYRVSVPARAHEGSPGR
jgi:GntR family transcriptional regulator